MQGLFLILGFIISSISLFASTPGILDTSFNNDGIVITDVGSSTIDAIFGSAVQPDGKIVTVGSSGSNIAMIRYTIDGDLDTQFGSTGIITQAIGTTAVAYGVAIQNDGKIVVCGTSDSDFFVARFLANGSLDTVGFNAATGYVIQTIGTTDAAYAVAVNPSNQKIIIAGSSDGAILVAQYTTAGALDTAAFNTTGYNITVHPGTSDIAYALAIQSDYKIVVTGSSDADIIVARYNSDGSLDTAGFNAGGTAGYNIQSLGGADVAYGVGFQSTEKIIVAGTNGTQAAVVRFTTAGLLDTTFGVATSGYNTAETFAGSSAIAYGCAVQQDDTIVVSGIVVSAGNNFLIACYLADGSGLDTSFGFSSGYTSTQVGVGGQDSLARALSIQSNGRFVAAGSVATNGGDFATARYLGASGVQGCIDVTYNSSGTSPGYVTYPTDSTAANKPQVKALQAMSNNKVYVLTEDVGTVTKSQVVQLNADGTNSLTAVDITQVGATDLIVDSQQRVLAIGTTSSSPAGWLYRSASSTSLTGDTTFGTSGVATNTASFRRVGEQKQGRILVIGQSAAPDATRGILLAYNEAGVLASQSQTLCVPFGRVSDSRPGFITYSNATYYDLLIDSNDGIYILHKAPIGTIQIFKLLPNGSGNDTTFGTNGTVDTGWAIASYGIPAMTFDANGNIVVAAINTSTNTIAIQRFTPTSTTTTSGSILQATSLLSTPILTKLQCDTNNRLIFNGYDANVFFVARCTSGAVATLDATFAPYSSSPGILKTMYNDNNPTDATTPKRVSNEVCIVPNGTILFGGYENISSTTTISIIGNVVGDTTPYGQVARYPGASLTGTINTNFGTNGALSLADSPASLPAGTARPMYVLANDKILVADTNGTDTVLGQLTSSYSLDTASFGDTIGYVTLTGLVNPVDIMVDTSNNIYVVGDNGSNAKVYKISSAGVLLWSMTSNSLTQGNAVAQQASGRIIVGGYNGSSGVIAGYNATNGALDTTFGTSGYYTTGVASRIGSLTVTANDKILLTYRAADATGPVVRLLPSGVVDSSFSFGTALTSIATSINNQSQVRLQLDVNGKIDVVARNTTGNFIARRYLATGADDVSTVTMTLASASTSALKDLLALSNGSTLALGLNTTGNTAQVAQLNSAFALDTNFSYGTGILQTAVSPITTFYSLDVTADQGILVAGASTTPNPYFTQIYNNAVVTKVNQSTAALGTPGTIDTTFGTSGEVLLASLSGATGLAGLTPQIVLPTASGQYYIAFTDGSLIRLTNAPILDTTFDTDGFASATPAGIQALIIDGLSRLMAAGASGGAGWVKRYNANLGTLDTTFNTTVATSLATLESIGATTIAEQTLGRYIIAGTLAGGNGALFAVTNSGAIDTTFNSNGTVSIGGTTPGIFNTGVANGVYALAVDQFDRLIIAYKNGSNIDVVRLTSAGQLDTLFNSTGIVSSALTDADDATQVRLVIDSAGNIIVAAHTTSGISLRGLTTLGANLYTQVNIATIITSTPVLTNLVATSDGNVLLSGYQATTSPMWVARVTVAGVLDTAFGGGDGIMTFSFDGSATARGLNSIAIYGDGEIAMVGTETVSAVITPFLAMAYNAPYITQVSQSPDSKAIGTNDITLGASSATATALGVTFFATAAAAADSGQVARAVALQDNANILVAVDGGASAGATTPSNMYLKRFNIDGVADSTFGTSGQQTVLSSFANQYVQDIVTFTTVAGVHKAILVGYTYNSALPVANQYNSLLLQYNLDNQSLDTGFGGFNGNNAGLACGDGKQLFAVGQQTTGRIIASGLSQDDLGLLLGYTSSGKLDTSFGNNGYQSSNTGSTGIYTQAIDTQNRVVIAYNNGSNAVAVARFLADGSALDSSFATPTPLISTISGNTNIKVAVDSANNVVVAAVTVPVATANTISVKIYSAAGGTATQTATIAYSSLGGSITSVYTLARLLVDTSGNVIVVAYDSTAQKIVVARLTSLLALDTANFNAPSGYLLYAIAGGATSQVATDAIIHPDGRIIIVGCEN